MKKLLAILMIIGIILPTSCADAWVGQDLINNIEIVDWGWSRNYSNYICVHGIIKNRNNVPVSVKMQMIGYDNQGKVVHTKNWWVCMANTVYPGGLLTLDTYFSNKLSIKKISLSVVKVDKEN